MFVSLRFSVFADRLSVWSVHYLWWGFSAGYIVTQVGGGATSEFMSESLNHTLGFESFKNETSLASVGRCREGRFCIGLIWNVVG